MPSEGWKHVHLPHQAAVNNNTGVWLYETLTGVSECVSERAGELEGWVREGQDPLTRRQTNGQL